MRKATDWRPSSAQVTVGSRPAVEGDIPFLFRLRADTMGPHRRAAGLDESPGKLDEKVKSHFSLAEILEIEGHPIGMWKVSRMPEAWDLLQLQISPVFQARGIGTRLVTALVVQAGTAGVPLDLSVLKVNPARRLYQRLGFRIIAESEHALKMRSHG